MITEKSNMNPPLIHQEVRLICGWLEVVHSLTPLEDFKLSENQTMKKWKQVLSSPPRESHIGEYEVIIAAFPQACFPGVSNDWCIRT